MITKEMTYKKAFALKAERLKRKEKEHEMLLKSAYFEKPRLGDIDLELSKIGAELAVTALSGDMQRLQIMSEQSAALSKEKSALLKECGISDIKYECQLCLDTGYVSGKICDCIKREATAITVKELSSQMPLEGSTFENFDLKYYSDKTDKNGENPRRRMTAILKLCREYAINFTPNTAKNLLFFGGAGLGKTHLTLSIVSAVIEKGYLPVYGSAENLFRAVENEKFEGEDKGSYTAMLNCDLLVIDDLGTEMATTFTKSVLYNLVNTRILSGKPTIINTNLTMKEIEERYTARILSRFIGEYDWNKFLGEDIRQQKLRQSI